MKTQFLGLILLFTPLVTVASSTVCSSEKLYFSDVHADLGAPPSNNMILGRTVIVYDGKLLLDLKTLQGAPKPSSPSYSVTLQGAQQILAKEGNATAGALVYKRTAVIKKINIAHPMVVASEAVVCRNVWLNPVVVSGASGTSGSSGGAGAVGTSGSSGIASVTGSLGASGSAGAPRST